MLYKCLSNGYFPYVNQKYARVTLRKAGNPQEKGKLTIQCEELWSFVDNKGNKQWAYLAMDADTREIVSVYIGARYEAAAQALWDSLLPVYRQCAVASPISEQPMGLCHAHKRPESGGQTNGSDQMH